MTKTCRQGRLPTTHLLRCQNIVTYGRLRFYSSTDPFIQFVSHSRKKNKRLATATGLRRATAFAVLGQSPDLVHNFPITLRRAWCRTVVFVRVCVCVCTCIVSMPLFAQHFTCRLCLVYILWPARQSAGRRSDRFPFDVVDNENPELRSNRILFAFHSVFVQRAVINDRCDDSLDCLDTDFISLRVRVAFLWYFSIRFLWFLFCFCYNFNTIFYSIFSTITSAFGH